MRILIVEDEPKVASFLKQGLEEKNFQVDVAYDGEMGRNLAFNLDYDVILLDLIIPYINGLDLCRQIREKKPEVHILIITALGSTDNKVTGLDAGADDYLVKPFEFKELLARINVLSRRSRNIQHKGNSIKVADIELDIDRKVAIRGERVIELTAKEFALLDLLMHNAGRVVSRAEIAEKIWEITFDTGTNVVDVYINILRKKIDRDFPSKLIHTRIGHGYIFQEE
jgi:two-component system, OmpR family, copper resistance phosphate regulon response regulator CusR